MRAERAIGSKPPPSLRERAEAAVRATRADIASMAPEKIQRLVHELQVHQIELEMQNEELRHAHAELGASRDRFNDLYDFAPVGYVTLDQDGTVLEANLTSATMLGVPRNKLVGRKFTRFVTRGSQDTLYLHQHRILGSDKKQICELLLHGPNGATFLARLETIGVRDAASGRLHCRSAIIDITELELREGAIKRTMSLLRATLDSTSEGVLVVDGAGKITDYNRRFVELWRLPAAILETGTDEEALQYVLDQLEEPERFLSKVRQLYSAPEQSSADVLVFKDGRVFERYSQPQWLDNLPVGRVWSFRDVTARRQAEDALARSHAELERRVVERTAQLTHANKALRESEEHFRQLVHALPVAVYTCDAKGRITLYNAAAVELWGREPKLNRDQWSGAHRLFTPDGKRLSRAHSPIALTVRQDEPIRGAELITERPDGSRSHALAFPDPIHDCSGAVVGAVNVIVDITALKNAEIALRTSGERLRLALDAAHLATWDWQIPSDRVEWNEEHYRIMGYEPGGVAPSYGAWADRVHPDDLPAIEARIRASQKRGGDYAAEYRVLWPDGTIRHAEALGRFDRDAAGRAVRCYGVMRDITESKRAETRLREREERLRAILNTVTDAIVTIDLSGVITSVNPATERMFGYSDIEMIGENVNMLMPAPYREEHDGYFANYHRAGEARIIGMGREVKALRKDGTIFPIELAVAEIKDMQLYTGVIRDITERKRLEAEVLGIGEKERLRVAADLHDGICQELVGLQYLSNLLRRDLEAARHPLTAQARRIEDATVKAADHTRQVARGMNPVVADGSGLRFALRQLVATTAHMRQIRCVFECPSQVSIDDPSVANELYRITQEAIHNAISHGHAKRIIVRLRETGGQVCLAVMDNGRGFPTDISQVTGMGLRVMKYRAGSIGGQLVILPRQRGGTEVICRVPKPSVNS